MNQKIVTNYFINDRREFKQRNELTTIHFKYRSFLIDTFL